MTTLHPTIVSVQGVSKRFVMHKDKSIKERLVNAAKPKHADEFWALRDIDIDVEAGSTVGLVGHNGSGKSTLLKVVGGIIQPTTGHVLRRGRMAALLELGAGFHPDLTGRENVYLNAAILGLSRSETERHFDAIIGFSGIEDFIDTQVKFYSSGMYVRLAFSVAVHVDPDLLLVDEVLAVGDEPFQRKCMDKIAEFQSEGRTIILVSHSAEQVGALCDRVVVLHAGEIQHDGDPANGLRILRAGYEADRKQSVVAETEPTAGGVPEYYLRAAETVISNSARDEVTIQLEVEINDPQPSWGVGLSIETSLGMKLYSMTTFESSVALPNTRGRHRLSVVIPDLRLGAGQYLVNVGLGDQAGRTFHRVAGATSFESPRDDVGHGLIRLSPRFQVSEGLHG
ncbi:ABC-2 type transport system ATP-binding protein [Okibacterium sp. HSC-33S16]|uniref:ABC transporter ATP-binding protein n=1 Tax=Okibacterium sp. HSC-33S16 TaxID=2910965 RepID=UPI00209E6D0B|nr:ABC transporter ATP-binding protein [Okibacterium sp. HSC-33S16]MCP2031673.1 ABC-2 type transport system ATP-binding protein [Okibacterium sp. HSC-33S16]